MLLTPVFDVTIVGPVTTGLGNFRHPSTQVLGQSHDIKSLTAQKLAKNPSTMTAIRNVAIAPGENDLVIR